MDEGTSLDDILSGNEPEPIAEPVQEAAAPEEPQSGQPRDEHGRFAPKETGVETPPAPVEASAEPVPPTEQPQGLPPEEFKALKEERRKRQEAEARAAALEAQYQQMQARPPVDEPTADFWEDPQGFLAKQFDQFGGQLMQRWQQQQQAERIDASEAAARSKYADYDDAFHAFRQAVQTNPTLAQKMASSPDPAEFAYKTGRTALDLERVGSIDELLKAERAKWEAEARQVIQPAAQPMFPSSTVTERSVGQRRGPEWSGPTPLGDILTP